MAPIAPPRATVGATEGIAGGTTESTTATAPATVEGPASWRIAIVALATLAVSFGSPYVAVVALKAIAAETGGQRSVPALATSLAWFGTAHRRAGDGAAGRALRRALDGDVRRHHDRGGPGAVGPDAERGEVWQLYVGHALFIGLLGNAGINAPLYIYVTRWFDRRRGTALALISSGQYVAGAFWPPIFERAIAEIGWRQTMLLYGLVVAGLVVPLAAIFMRRPPEAAPLTPAAAAAAPVAGARVLGLPGNLVFGAAAGRQLPVLRADGDAVGPHHRAVRRSRHDGRPRRDHAVGAAGLRGRQPAALGRAVGPDRRAEHDPAVVAGAGGVRGRLLGDAERGGAVRGRRGLRARLQRPDPRLRADTARVVPGERSELARAGTLLFGGSGMATGGWLAGYIYDGAGAYAPAFATGLVFNLANLAIVVFLVLRARRYKSRTFPTLRPAAA